MKFKIVTTSEDFYEFYKASSRLIQPLVMKNKSLRILLFISLILIMVGLIFITIFYRELCINGMNNLNYGLTSLVASMIILAIYFGRCSEYSILQIAENSKIISGNAEIELNDQGIHEQKIYSQASFSWELVSHIEKTETHLFIFLGLSMGIIFPLNQINTEIEQKIQDYCPNIPFTLYKKKFNQ